MVKFPSEYSEKQLADKWDEYTSVSRFAGCDETMDLIYVSKRNKDKVKLVRKAKIAHEPFSTVFRGKISKTESGSEISGYFTKSIADYIVAALFIAAVVYIRSYVIGRNDDPSTVNALLAIATAASVLCLVNYKSTKRKYADFICRITGKENVLYLSKSELKEKKDH